jgi:hypothetical protein
MSQVDIEDLAVGALNSVQRGELRAMAVIAISKDGKRSVVSYAVGDESTRREDEAKIRDEAFTLAVNMAINRPIGQF